MLRLEPLRPAHAAEMAPLLDDERLHTFIGGRPVPADELHERYVQLARGRSPDGRARWLNWIVRRTADGQAVGVVQATVTATEAALAWTVATRFQGRGYAQAAAAAMLAELAPLGVTTLSACIHPDHRASQRVATAIGLRPTDTLRDGEVVWRGELGRADGD